MEAAEELDKKTRELDQLINKTNSGKKAWRAGRLLVEIKTEEEYKKKNYTSFGTYTNRELKISESRAYSYIKIYQTIEEDSISNAILVTHLKEIVKYERDIRELLLKQIKAADFENYKRKLIELTEIALRAVGTDKEIDGTLTPSENNALVTPPCEFTTDEIAFIASLLEVAKEKHKELSSELVQLAIDIYKEVAEDVEAESPSNNPEKDNQNKQKLTNSKGHKLPNAKGGRMSSSYFNEVCEMFPHKPICEMEVVGLFCIMFPYIKEIPFKYGRSSSLTYLHHIDYLRAAFPDAEITIKCSKSEHLTTLKLEFEFKSKSYLTHKHIKSIRECNLIVCWENNLKASDLEPFGLKFPPIISLKQVLETGKITLIG